MEKYSTLSIILGETGNFNLNPRTVETSLLRVSWFRV